jgi:putative ABC transport system permease protein
MLVMGFDPARDLLSTGANTIDLFKDGQILVDSLTRTQFGPLAAGVTTEIGGMQVRIAGHYRIGPGFATDGAAVMSDDTFVRTFRERSIEQPSIGVLRLEQGTDAERIAAELRRTLPQDTQVLTQVEMIRREQDFWIRQTSIGPVFASGGVLGLIIGAVVIYEVVATDIANRLREYAALKALGYDSRRLRSIALDEVLMFSVLGFAAGWLLSAGLYKIVQSRTGLPMSMHAIRSAGVFLLTLGMCWISGLLATRKLGRADPADLC